MPDDYHDPPGWHRHTCDQCGCIWSHENAVAALPKSRLFDAHCCPGCGTYNAGFLYLGPSAPELITPQRQPERATDADR